jgi:transketolase
MNRMEENPELQNLALNTFRFLSAHGVQQPAYQDAALPADIPARLAVEAGITMGWHRWVDSKGRVLAIVRYGASAPANMVFEKLGLTGDNVLQIAQEIV